MRCVRCMVGASAHQSSDVAPSSGKKPASIANKHCGDQIRSSSVYVANTAEHEWVVVVVCGVCGEGWMIEIDTPNRLTDCLC